VEVLVAQAIVIVSIFQDIGPGKGPVAEMTSKVSITLTHYY